MRRLLWLTAAALALAAALYIGLRRLTIEPDITRGLPRANVVVQDARYIATEHPAADRLYLDLSLDGARADRALLLACATTLEGKLRRSGLFRRVGLTHLTSALLRLPGYVARHLPILFDRRELESKVSPKLQPEQIAAAVAGSQNLLTRVLGFGRELQRWDPLGLREIVMARLRESLPGTGAVIHGGRIMTRDGRHLLLIVQPKAASTDTNAGRKITALLDQVRKTLAAQARRAGRQVRLTAVGGYRAALDNERVIRRDTTQAIVAASLGIVLLILLCFRRPFRGLLSFLPALAGMAIALLVYSLVWARISAIALGFGGALISISVDHGIAFVLFMDRRPGETGRTTAKRVWSLGLVAALSTSLAFLALVLSGFPLLAEVGLFAAVGVMGSFAFVHIVFPVLLARAPAARRPGPARIDRALMRLTTLRPRTALIVLVAVGGGMALVARPTFRVDLRSMNTVSADTLAAEARMKRAWGDVNQRVLVLLSGRTVAELTRLGDRLGKLLDRERERGGVAQGLSPSAIFPGPATAQARRAAWQAFWTPSRRDELRAQLTAAARRHDLDANAFAPFLGLVDGAGNPAASGGRGGAIPREFFPLLEVVRNKRGDRWLMLTSIRRGPGYDGERFGRAASAAGLRIFDGVRFTQHLGRQLADVFLTMLAVVAAGVTLLLLILLVDWRLVLVCLAPLALSLVCTLGTLTLLGRPLDIPGLMLAVVVLGMGLDYTLYLVRAHQYDPGAGEAVLPPVLTAVFLAGGSTLIGLGTLIFSEHAVLHSTGLTTSLGIAFALAAALALVPPFLRALFRPLPPAREAHAAGSRAHRRWVDRRYRHLDPFARLFAWFKQRTDPMFPRLADWIEPTDVVLDVGAGYGVPAVWLLGVFPRIQVLAVEPDVARLRVVRRVLSPSGRAVIGCAPDLPVATRWADVVLLLDIIHYLNDEELVRTLADVRRALKPGGRLVLRATVPTSVKRFAWERWIETARQRLARRPVYFRSEETLTRGIENAGLDVQFVGPSAPLREETWIVGRVRA